MGRDPLFLILILLLRLPTNIILEEMNILCRRQSRWEMLGEFCLQVASQYVQSVIKFYIIFHFA
jgi:hypothetical protein